MKNHFIELKFRLFYLFLMYLFNSIIFIIYIEELSFFLLESFISNLNYFIFTDFIEKIYLNFYFPLYVSIIVIIPFLLIYFCMYVSSGLNFTEHYNLKICLCVFCIFFYVSYIIFFNYIISNVMNFFIVFNLSSYWTLFEIHNELKILNLLFIILYCFFLFFLIFLIPLILVITLVLYNKIFIEFLRLRKYCYISLIILTSLTLYDIFNQIFLIIILILIFEFVIFIISYLILIIGKQ